MSKAVLIVDDDPMAIRLLRHHLSQEGYVVLTARNGVEAIELIRHNADPPSLVVTDWEMPEMDGIELCRVLNEHAQQGLGYIYTIVVTANDAEERIIEAVDAGADDYLTKPFRTIELLARIRAGERIVELEQDLARKTREVFRSNAEMELVNRRLNEMASTDELTGCPNRRAAMSTLDRQWTFSLSQNEPLACIAIDIDNFKAFNDTYGHDVGDLVLRETATVMNQATRAREPLYRVGGEEFLVLCPRADATSAAAAAERFRELVQGLTIDHPEGPFKLTVSLGVAERSARMTKSDDLLKEADEALYESKRAGRNRVTIRDRADDAALPDEHRASA